MSDSQPPISVAFDATSLAKNIYGGISQVTAEILTRAAQHDEIAPTAWYAGGNRQHVEQYGVATHKYSWHSRFTARPVDIFHALRHRTLPIRHSIMVYTVHDAWSLRPNRWQSEDFQRKLGARLRREIQSADHIATVSGTVRDELLAMQLVDSERITVIPNGVSVPGDQNVDKAHEELRGCLGKPFVLFVGYLENRKNIPHVLEAVRGIEQLDLILVGGHGYGIELIESDLARFPANRLHRLQCVSPLSLDFLYRQAVALLLPSFEEGFGMPILEAMIRGCPVITSNRSANAEIAGTAAVLVDPDHPAESATALKRILADDTFARSLKDSGKQQAARYTWEESFLSLVQLYRRLLDI